MSKAATRGEELQHTLENAGAQIMASVDESRLTGEAMPIEKLATMILVAFQACISR